MIMGMTNAKNNYYLMLYDLLNWLMQAQVKKL